MKQVLGEQAPHTCEAKARLDTLREVPSEEARESPPHDMASAAMIEKRYCLLA